MTTPIILALIAAGVPPLVGLVVYFYQAALAHLPANKQALLIQAAHTAVNAAEQMGFTSDQKKRQATAIVESALKTWGITIDPSYVDATIEALVRGLKQTGNTVTPTQTTSGDPTAYLHTSVGALSQLMKDAKAATPPTSQPIVLPPSTP